MARLQQYAGGAFGAGGTISARQFLDEAGQNRLTQPSVLFGLGTGVLAGALWFTDVETPVFRDEFWASHAMTAIPTGAFYAAFPKKSGTSTTEQVRSLLSSSGSGGTSSGGSRSSSERASVEIGGGANLGGRRR